MRLTENPAVKIVLRKSRISSTINHEIDILHFHLLEIADIDKRIKIIEDISTMNFKRF